MPHTSTACSAENSCRKSSAFLEETTGSVLQPVVPVDHVVGPGFRIVFMSVLVPLILYGDTPRRWFLPVDFLPRASLKHRLRCLFRQGRTAVMENAMVILHYRQKPGGINQVSVRGCPDRPCFPFSFWEEISLTLGLRF